MRSGCLKHQNIPKFLTSVLLTNKLAPQCGDRRNRETLRETHANELADQLANSEVLAHFLRPKPTGKLRKLTNRPNRVATLKSPICVRDENPLTPSRAIVKQPINEPSPTPMIKIVVLTQHASDSLYNVSNRPRTVQTQAGSNITYWTR